MILDQDQKYRRLFERHQWPDRKPDIPFNDKGWFPKCNQQMLARYLPGSGLVLELGAWLGLSTRWILTNSNAKVVTIDHWRPETVEEEKAVPLLYETFLSNCWAFKDRLMPLRDTTESGINQIKEMGLRPDVVYVDAGHDYESARRDILACADFGCVMVGDDFNPNAWPGVVRAVWECAVGVHTDIIVHGSSWAVDMRH